MGNDISASLACEMKETYSITYVCLDRVNKLDFKLEFQDLCTVQFCLFKCTCPECERLWQRPKYSFQFGNGKRKVVEKKLRIFLSTPSKSLNFGTMQIHQSIIPLKRLEHPILSKCMFGPSQVMAVTEYGPH